MPRPRDPRLYQIACLSGLLAYGLLPLGFDIGPAQVVLTLGGALLAQLLCGRLAGVPRFEPKSALISGLSLCLLLRTDSLPLAVAAAFLTIASKFALRVRGKHVFNPTNFGVVAMILLSDRVWASAGQWGTGGFFAFLMACLGGLVAHRAWRSDVAWAFLGAHVAFVFGRAAFLGDPLTIPLHSLESGALLLFAFFMISDPRDDPGRARGARRVRRAGGRRRLLRAVPPVPHERPPLVARSACRRWCRSSTGCSPATATLAGARTGALVKETSMQRSWPILAGSRWRRCALSPPPVLRLLRREGRHEALQPGLAGRDRAGRRPHGHDHGQRLPGRPEEFALVIPVPTVVKREQIAVADKALLDHLDAYSSPRLVEYHDPDPCGRSGYDGLKSLGYLADRQAPMAAKSARERSLGVTIEAAIYRRRVRHPDPLREGERRARRPGCARTATASREAPRPCWAATSASRCASSSRA